MLICEVIRTVVPYRSLDYFWRYFRYVESAQAGAGSSGQRRADLSLLLLLHVYFNVHWVYKLFAGNLSPFDRFLHADVVDIFYSRHLYVVPITLDLLAFYFVYIFYVRPDRRVVALHERLLKRSARMRRNFYIQANVMMFFIVVVDLAIAYWHVGYLRMAWTNYHDRLFNAGALGYIRLTFHLLNSLVLDFCLLNYSQICLLVVILGFSSVLNLEFRLKCNLRRLTTPTTFGSNGSFTTGYLPQLRAFVREDLRTFHLIFISDRVYGRLFMAFMLLNYPTNALLSMLIILDKIEGGLTLFTVTALTAEQTIGIFAIHLFAAAFAKRAHASANILLILAARRQHRAGRSHIRTKLTLEATIARLHTKKRYGFTYGSLALISMDTFFRCLLLYGKCIMLSYRMIQTN